MLPSHFEGAVEVGKPAGMTDEECFSVWAVNGIQDKDMARGYIGKPIVYTETPAPGAYKFWLTYWKPSYEDMQAFQRGEGVYIKTIAQGLPPMAVFTVDEKGFVNE